MPQRFAATQNAFEKGIENVGATQGAKLAADRADDVKVAEKVRNLALAMGVKTSA